MSRAEFSRGVLLCMDNAEKWMEEADLLAQKGSYGHATALLIHGIEALSQAWICFSVARGTAKYDEPHVMDYFKRHDIKLDFFIANLLMFETQEEFYRNHFTEEDFWNLNILPLLNFYERKQEEIKEKRKKYPKELMEKRNQGIYVDFDYKKQAFYSPQVKGEKDYLILKKEGEILLTTIFTLINNPLVKYR